MSSSKKLPIKVLHLSYDDIAHQMAILSAAQKKYLKKATSISYFENFTGDQCDWCFHLEKVSPKLKYLKWGFNLMKYPAIFWDFDIYNFHFGRSILPKSLDLPILKFFGKKIVFTFHGSDVRDRNLVVPGAGGRFSAVRTEKNREKALRYGDLIVVTTPDLLEFFPEGRAVWIPVAFPLKRKKYSYKKLSKNKFLIIHAPTNRLIKGTDYIIKAIKKLQKKYKFLKFKLIENLPRPEALKIYDKADLAIDQLMIGWYGLFAVEMMSLGVPTICYIREDLKKYAPDLPLINANKENIQNVIEQIIKNPEKLRKYQEEGFFYVKNNHETSRVALKYIKEYKRILGL